MDRRYTATDLGLAVLAGMVAVPLVYLAGLLVGRLLARWVDRPTLLEQPGGNA